MLCTGRPNCRGRGTAAPCAGTAHLHACCPRRLPALHCHQPRAEGPPVLNQLQDRTAKQGRGSAGGEVRARLWLPLAVGGLSPAAPLPSPGQVRHGSALAATLRLHAARRTAGAAANSPRAASRGQGRTAAAPPPTPRCGRQRQSRLPRCCCCCRWARCRPGAASCRRRCWRGRSTGAAAPGGHAGVGGWLAHRAGRPPDMCAAHAIAAALYCAAVLRAAEAHARIRQPPAASRHGRARACCRAPAAALTSASSGPICARHSTAVSLPGRGLGLQGGLAGRAGSCGAAWALARHGVRQQRRPARPRHDEQTMSRQQGGGGLFQLCPATSTWRGGWGLTGCCPAAGTRSVPPQRQFPGSPWRGRAGRRLPEGVGLCSGPVGCVPGGAARLSHSSVGVQCRCGLGAGQQEPPSTVAWGSTAQQAGKAPSTPSAAATHRSPWSADKQAARRAAKPAAGCGQLPQPEGCPCACCSPACRRCHGQSRPPGPALQRPAAAAVQRRPTLLLAAAGACSSPIPSSSFPTPIPAPLPPRSWTRCGRSAPRCARGATRCGAGRAAAAPRRPSRPARCRAATPRRWRPRRSAGARGPTP